MSLKALVLLAVIASAGTSVPTTPEQLHKIMTAVVAARSDFAELRGSAKSKVAGGIIFNLNPGFAKVCPGCLITDEFATAKINERFTAQGYWPLPLRTTLAQKTAFVQRNLAPFFKGYTYAHGKTDDGELWFQWEQGSPMSFGYFETYHSKTASGVSIRIGHFLPKNVYYVQWARLTPDERTDLANGVTELVIAGTHAGIGNFASMRGAATDKDNDYFHVNQTFGTVLTGCNISGIFANEGAGNTSKWLLECDTPALGGSKADILEVLRSSVASSLPADFTATTDPRYLGDSAYRWDRSSDATSVDISSYANTDGTTTFHITIYHYLN